MRALALLFPLWGVAAPVTLILFIVILLKLPANLPIPYALSLIFLMLFGIALCALLAMICDDDQISVNKDGLRFPIKFLPNLKCKNKRKWEELVALRVRWQRNEKFSPDEFLDFVFQDGGVVRLSLRHIDLGQLEQFFIAFESCAYKCERDADLPDFERAIQTRKQGNLYTYTELWDKSLASKFSGATYIPLEPNNRLQTGRYQILRQLAFGGFAAVYLARPQSGGFVVLKETNLQQSDEAEKKAAGLFAREASLLGKLNHPKIARVKDYFVENGRHYIVMEHIEGIDLGQLVLKSGPQAAPSVINWIVQIASALQYMHEQTPPIVHRDLSPDNLLLKPDGTIVIIDFGAANEIVGNLTRTIVGKQAFMAPEQFKGKPNAKSDVYSLGASAYFLLTGKQPEPLTPSNPTEVLPSVPPDLSDLIQKCTSQEESNRPDCSYVIKQLSAKISNAQSPIVLEEVASV